MFVIPCIDILNGECVQLINGRVETAKSYGSPKNNLEKWVRKGADIIHVIDLDAALNIGNNKKIIYDLLNNKNIRIQVGGGIRTIEYANDLIQNGAERIIIGSKALENGFLKKINQKIPIEKIMVALDTKSGKVVSNGWKNGTKINFENAVKKIKPYTGSILTTNINCEGLLKGPDTKFLKKIESGNIPIYVSGGFTSKKDIKLAEKLGFSGVVIGRAFYEKILDLEDLW